MNRAGSREQGAGSREQGAGSRGQGAGSMEHGALPWHWHGSSIYQEKIGPTLAHLWFQTLLRSSVKINNLILILVSTLGGQ